MKFRVLPLFLGLAVLLALAAGAPAAEKGFLWDGTHWKEMTKEFKAAYVQGVLNMADFEVSVGGASRGVCVSKAFVDSLKTKTLGAVVDEVDKFYRENPGKMKTQVIEVIMRRFTALCPPEAAAPVKKK